MTLPRIVIEGGYGKNAINPRILGGYNLIIDTGKFLTSTRLWATNIQRLGNRYAVGEFIKDRNAPVMADRIFEDENEAFMCAHERLILIFKNPISHNWSISVLYELSDSIPIP